MHHSMIDRVYWLWQALHLDQAGTIAGTITLNNKPASRATSLDDVIATNFLNVEPRAIGDLLSTIDDDPFCYIYL
jgi:tyrosinase